MGQRGTLFTLVLMTLHGAGLAAALRIEGGGFVVSDPAAEVRVTCLGKEASYTHRLYLDNTGAFICDSAEAGRSVNLGRFPAGTELIFRLEVTSTGQRYFTGPAARNPDGVTHAALELGDEGAWAFGFEDMQGGGDRDYNDCRFEVRGGVVGVEK